jgi:hypothetical protein
VSCEYRFVPHSMRDMQAKIDAFRTLYGERGIRIWVNGTIPVVNPNGSRDYAFFPFTVAPVHDIGRVYFWITADNKPCRCKIEPDTPFTVILLPVPPDPY